jgi:hypothetical protein
MWIDAPLGLQQCQRLPRADNPATVVLVQDEAECRIGLDPQPRVVDRLQERPLAGRDRGLRLGALVEDLRQQQQRSGALVSGA